MEISRQLHAPAVLSPGNNPGTQWMSGWVGATAILAAMNLLPLLGSEPQLVHPVAYTLYYLRYSGSHVYIHMYEYVYEYTCLTSGFVGGRYRTVNT